MSPPRGKAAAGRCPICERPRAETFKPFCSKRCADIDLARWLDGRYVIPGPNETNMESSAKEPEGED